MGQNGAGVEVDRRFDRGPGDVRIRCQVDDRVDPRHRGSKGLEVRHLAANDGQPRISCELVEVPFSPRGEIVENDQRFDGSITQEAVDEMAAYESGATHDAEVRDVADPLGAHFIPSHLALWRARKGCVTRRCQTTAHRPSVCGVTRSGYSGGISTTVSATHSGVASVTAHDGEDRRSAGSCQIHGRHQIARHVPFGIPTTDGQHEQSVEVVQVRSDQPVREDTLPPVVIDAGSQFRDIVGRRVRLETAQLTEIVDRMRGMTR